MTGFVRAVTEEQKLIRRNQIKAVARRQFYEKPLPDISLTTIAKELSITRASLYSYYSSVSEILVDIWAELYSDQCHELNDRLEKMEVCKAEDYAELLFQVYFNRNEFLMYATMLPILARGPECSKYLAGIRPMYRRYILKHLDLLQEKLELTREKAEAVHSEGYYEALGIFNAERLEAEVVPTLSPRYKEYMHRKYVVHMTASINQAVLHSRDPSTDPIKDIDMSYINDYKDLFRESVRNMKFD